jgi:hypothetical protein
VWRRRRSGRSVHVSPSCPVEATRIAGARRDQQTSRSHQIDCLQADRPPQCRRLDFQSTRPTRPSRDDHHSHPKRKRDGSPHPLRPARRSRGVARLLGRARSPRTCPPSGTSQQRPGSSPQLAVTMWTSARIDAALKPGKKCPSRATDRQPPGDAAEPRLSRGRLDGYRASRCRGRRRAGRRARPGRSITSIGDSR